MINKTANLHRSCRFCRANIEPHGGLILECADAKKEMMLEYYRVPGMPPGFLLMNPIRHYPAILLAPALVHEDAVHVCAVNFVGMDHYCSMLNAHELAPDCWTLSGGGMHGINPRL